MATRATSVDRKEPARGGRIAEARRPEPSADVAALTERGRQTRSRLVAAARAEFERNGYLATSVHDIARRAKVAYGTFYTYFSSKDEIFEEVVGELLEDMRRRETDDQPVGDASPGERIARANRSYLAAYQRNAAMMGVLEQVATFSPKLREVRREARRFWVERSRRAIERWQRAGLVDRSIDPYYASSALGSMVDRSAYVWLVLGESFDLDDAADQLTILYCNALGIEPPPQTRRRRRVR